MADNNPKNEPDHANLVEGGILLEDAEKRAAKLQREKDQQERQHQQEMAALQLRGTTATEAQANAAKATVRLSVALVVVAVIGSIVSYMQFAAAKDSADAARAAVMIASEERDSNEISSGQTLIQMRAQLRSMQESNRLNQEATKKILAQAEKALKANIDSFQLEQRAWIKADVRWYGPNPTNMVEVDITNVGKNVAMAPTVLTYVEVVEAASEPTFKAAFPDRNTHNPIYPGDPTVKLDARRLGNGGVRPFTPQEVQALRRGSAFLATYGDVVYNDQFGKHWTRFCQWHPYVEIDRAFNARSCIIRNAVGDGDPPP